jgi:glycosyltransferase involved in cell wall biosynthesis
MRLAIFTNQFPGPVCTFFARDMRGLIDAGIQIEVFPVYPFDPTLWRYVPDTLNDKILPRNKVHHLTMAECLQTARWWPSRKLARLLRDALSVSASAIRYGIEPIAKSSYVYLRAWVWARQYGDQFDHVLAYWGNYSATCAYIYHRLLDNDIPFSLFVHAGIDLYQTPLYMRQKLLYANNIITCSEFNYQYILQHFSDIADRIINKIYVHHHGVDLTEFSFAKDGRAPRRIIAVGRLEKEKGYDCLVRAGHLLRERAVDVEIEFVGDGSQRHSLISLAKDLGVADRVRFRGWLTPNDAREAMKQSAILVHPSPELGDGVPNVIKEAMAVGTPVVGSNVAGLPELLDYGRCGVIVPPKDVMALGNAIERLLADDALRQQYANAARERAERKFDLWQNGNRLAKILRETSREITRS